MQGKFLDSPGAGHASCKSCSHAGCKEPVFEDKSCTVMALLDGGTLRRQKSWLKSVFKYEFGYAGMYDNAKDGEWFWAFLSSGKRVDSRSFLMAMTRKNKATAHHLGLVKAKACKIAKGASHPYNKGRWWCWRRF
ncbi:hypothetical protein L6452_00346 [Arctium lappa]|uniref:Uncharacterized protein n=1 Tax=Arctium lappa TaxID=4217 RepID=A0ACB9FDL6_ARCLA|nr:hypothetical protein L6452_00346 [Arctium lappa]